MENQNQKKNPNLSIYEQLREVPKHAQKQFNNGSFSGTDINPMWRIKRMTEIFGPIGFGWYYEVVHRTTERSTDDKALCMFIGINLFVKNPETGEWSKPIYGEGGNTMCEYSNKRQVVMTSDEAFKMALTDAFSNAAKQLGLGADVWFENDKTHSTKYDQKQERNATAPAAPAPSNEAVKAAVEKMKAAKTNEEAGAIWKENASLQANVEFKKAAMEKSAEFKNAA